MISVATGMAVVISVVLASAPAMSRPVAAASDGWEWQNPLPQGDDLDGVWGSSGSDVFAVGWSGAIVHYNGSDWSAMTSGTTDRLRGVWGSFGSDVFAVGGGGTILRYNGTDWSAMTSGTNRMLRGLWGSSGSDVFAVGGGGTILRYNGTDWSAMTSGTSNHLSGVWGSSPSDVFAAGSAGTILHYGPNIAVDPLAVDFGPVRVGSSSAARTVTVTNGGCADLTIGALSLGGANPGEFSIQNDNCSGQAIAPAVPATVEVVFSPTSVGTSATLIIPSNDPNENPVNVALNGNGIQQTQQVSTITGTGTATFTTGSGSVTGLTAVAEATLPAAGKPAGVSFPHGLFSFNITGIPAGSTATITITLPSPVPVGTQYWKCLNGVWVQIPVGDDDGDNVITIQLTDGGLGDGDGAANGTIVDPGGPGGVGTVAAPAMPDGASTGGPPPARVTAPDLRPKYLSVNPKQAYANQPVTILTNVVNRGNMAGSYMVNLLINGQVEQRKTVSVSAGGTQPVRFTVTKVQPGTYIVAVGGDRARFTVIGAGQEPSVGSGNGAAVGLATFVLVLVAGLLLLVVRKRFQAG